MPDRCRRRSVILLACLAVKLVYACPAWGAPTFQGVDVHPADPAGLYGGGQIKVAVQLAGGGLNPAPVRVDLRIQLEGKPSETLSQVVRCPIRGCGTGYSETLTYRIPIFCEPANRDLLVQANAGAQRLETSTRIQAALPARANLAIRQPMAAHPEFTWTVREAASHCPASSQVLCVGPQRQVADVSAPLCRERSMVRAFRLALTSEASFTLPDRLEFSGEAVAVLTRCDTHGRCVPSLPVYFVVP